MPSQYLENLANLSDLTVANIMKELKGRYDEKEIYTYVGDILIATNPYERLPIYGSDIGELYKGGRSKEDLPPHVYALADRAYEAMLNTKADQCFVVSGESGAGKSETTKFLVRHLMDLCQSGRTALEENIREVNPMLEAFGNAKTVMNDNSSRFGKYLELQFDMTGAITGAKLFHYLLEKSRVAVRNADEQNFHIFYQMYAGLSAEGKLNTFNLDTPSRHHYLQGQGAPTDSQIMSDRFQKEWEEVMGAMSKIGFKNAQLESMISLLACILRFGDTVFADAGNDSAEITSDGREFRETCRMIKVSPEDFEKAFLHTSTITRGEVITKNFTMEKANANRDATCKAIYSRIFSWIFKSANGILEDKESANDDKIMLGLLDIFGFENFKWNSLEQMCINITNEQLQNYFNHYIFVMEQEEYKKEGVDFSKIDFVDNQTTLDMFLKKPQGIFSILDEEAAFPRASDLSFTTKCTAALANHVSKAFKGPRSDRDMKFEITHFAGGVMYETLGFLEKNRDLLSQDVAETLQNSTDHLLSDLFDPSQVEEGKSLKQGTNKRKSTLAGGFKESLLDLVKRLNLCAPHFIRCLKPNSVQKASNWDPELVNRQLLYAGVLETIKIRKMGYSYRLSFEDFVSSYKILAFKFNENPPKNQATAAAIMKHIKLEGYQIGTNKVFMKYYHADDLAAKARIQTDALVFMQKVVKAYVVRMKHGELVAAKRRQEAQLAGFLGEIEDMGDRRRSKFQAILDEDTRENEKRPWLERVKQQAAWSEADKVQKEQEREEALKAKANEPVKVKTKMVNGYFVWLRNEHFTLKAGALEHPWRKKEDDTTGRFFFKNVDKKTTQWVDPRSHEHRPHDALETRGDNLPYGWDEAETEDGIAFYINHLNNTHHKEHPRVQLQKKKSQYARKEQENAEIAEQHLTVLKDLRTKRRRIQAMLVEAHDEETRNSLQSRLQAMDKAIDKESSSLDSVKHANEALLMTITNLRERKNKLTPEQATTKAAGMWLKKGLGKGR